MEAPLKALTANAHTEPASADSARQMSSAKGRRRTPSEGGDAVFGELRRFTTEGPNARLHGCVSEDLRTRRVPYRPANGSEWTRPWL